MKAMKDNKEITFPIGMYKINSHYRKIHYGLKHIKETNCFSWFIV